MFKKVLFSLPICASLFLSIWLIGSDGASVQKSEYLTPLGTKRMHEYLLKATQESDGPATKIISEHLFRRDSRNKLARFTLAYNALNNGNAEQFVELYLPLFDLDKGNRRIYARAMAYHANDNAIRSIIDKRLSGGTGWSGLYQEELLEVYRGDLNDLVPTYQNTPKNQYFLLNKFIQNGNIDGAYRAFKKFVGFDDTSTEQLVYDSQFDKLNGPRPFNWEINASLAEIDNNGKLVATFFGRNRPEFASQILPIEPGNYLLEAGMSGYASKEAGRFGWSIECVGEQKIFEGLGPITLSAKAQIFSAEFSVPEDCDFIHLSLSGLPGDFPQSVQAYLDYASIRELSDDESGR